MAASANYRCVGRFNPFVSCSVPAIAIACVLACPGAAFAQGGAADSADSSDIIVTAQKRQQSINDVPMSITAATGDQLKLAGVKDVLDLPKITPGLTLGSSTTGTPVFTIRGVGYNDPAISARPAVTVYLDEAPIPFNGEAMGAGLDVERVEILKGPQGTLFGNNSTGGAINYVAKKPTQTFEAGGNFTYGRFNETNIDAYISGPISSSLSARLAVEHRGGSEWQRSYTRNDTLGRKDFTNGRFSLLWEPNSKLKAQLTVTRWVDRSDAPAAQVYEIREQVSGLLGLTGLAGYPAAPRDNRAADWNPGENFARNNRYTQITGRIDYDLSNALTVTSISSYMRYHQFLPVDTDGTAVKDIRVDTAGDIKSFAQELRVSAKLDRVNAVLGVNYANDKPNEQQGLHITNSTVANSFLLGFGSLLDNVGTKKAERITSYAVFGNLEYELTDQLTLQGGLRYTKTKDRFTGCTNDLGTGEAAAAITGLLNNALRPAFGLPPIAPIQPGSCVTFSPVTLTPMVVLNTLDEDNVSWRAGAQYKASRDLLLYANVSKGYKAGGFGSVTAFAPAGLDPAVQESVLAYEGGFKAGLLNGAVQLNGAAFFYDYRNKQVTGTVLDPILGTIAKLINVPKSSIAGAELQLGVKPVAGLNMGVAASYIHTKVRDHFTSFDSFGQPNVDFNGTRLPFAPDWQVSANARYTIPVSNRVDAFVGGNMSYQSESFSDLGEIQQTRLKPYTLVDLQAGVESPDGNWQAYIWGRNVFNTFYNVNRVRLIDTISGFAGRPATFGATVSYKFR